MKVEGYCAGWPDACPDGKPVSGSRPVQLVQLVRWEDDRSPKLHRTGVLCDACLRQLRSDVHVAAVVLPWIEGV